MSSAQFAKDQTAAGLFPAAKGFDNLLAGDAKSLRMLNMLQTQPLYLFYGSDLPPKLVVVYDDVTQQIYGLSTTPEKAAADLQVAAQSP